MNTHEIRHRLTLVNKRILYTREVCTQPKVDNELVGLITDICNLGDELDEGFNCGVNGVSGDCDRQG